jgi:AraC family ethanolamine operon transcriptional activator
MDNITANGSARTGRMETYDLDEHAESVRPWDICFDQMDRGAFRARTDFVQTPRLMIYRQTWNRRLRAIGATPAGMVFIGAPISRNDTLCWYGEDVTRETFVATPPTQAFDFSTSNQADHAVLLINPELLVRFLGHEATDALMSGNAYPKFNPLFSARLAGTIVRLVGKYQLRGELLNDERECEAVEYELLELLAENSCVGTARRTGMPAAKRRKALLRAVDYADGMEKPVPVPRLASAAGVSQRTLEYAFKEVYGISPTRYLRHLRMNKLRRVLIDSDQNLTTVTQCAAQFGFGELGRLAIEYRQLFGETPSATLARSKTAARMRLEDKW